MKRSDWRIYITIALFVAAFSAFSLAAQTDNSNGYEAGRILGSQIDKIDDSSSSIISLQSGPINSDKIVQKARRWLADKLNVPLGWVKLVSIEQVDWPDSCLGLPEPGESCLMVITPGYRMIFSVKGEKYELHTDLAANNIRMVQ